MRGALLSLALLFTLGAALPARASAVSPAAPAIGVAGSVYAQQIPDKTIDINVNTRGSVVWYRNPVWIAIGILALIVVLLLVVLLTRGGGGTTIVRG